MNKFFLGVIVFLSIVIIAGSYVVLRAKTPLAVSVTKYSTNDNQKPKVEIDRTSYDLKSIKVSDTASAKFTIKNTGNKPLQLFDISSSCGCTVGQVIYKGQESAEYGMHSVGSFATPIESGTEATVKVIYRPFVMPVYGAVQREVYISTNDPENPKLVLQVKALVK